MFIKKSHKSNYSVKKSHIFVLCTLSHFVFHMILLTISICILKPVFLLHVSDLPLLYTFTISICLPDMSIYTSSTCFPYIAYIHCFLCFPLVSSSCHQHCHLSLLALYIVYRFIVFFNKGVRCFRP